MSFREWWKKSNPYKRTVILTILIGMSLFYLLYFISTIGNLIQQDRLTCLSFGGSSPCSFFEFIFALIIHSLIILIEFVIPITLIILLFVYIFLKIKKR